VALIARCATQDGQALAELYRRASPTLLGCLLRILRRRALAEEALQDVFVQVWQRAAQFDEYRGRAIPWLVSIARYRAIDILRRERAEAVDPQELAEREMTSSGDPAELELASAGERWLDYCLNALSDDQRATIRLAYLEGRTHIEVASALDRPLGSVKSWIRRGLRALRECLDSCAIRAPS
jgi:RNA polymerase sigma-70 factor (ECF subfamily)